MAKSIDLHFYMEHLPNREWQCILCVSCQYSAVLKEVTCDYVFMSLELAWLLSFLGYQNSVFALCNNLFIVYQIAFVLVFVLGFWISKCTHLVPAQMYSPFYL